MLEKIIKKYALNNTIGIDKIASAIADGNKRIIWHNKTLRETLGVSRVKGRTINGLFKQFIPEKNINNLNDESVDVNFCNEKKKLNIKTLKSNGIIDGYLITLKNSENNPTKNENNLESFQRNLVFQKELQKILSILIKEKSVTTLAQEILSRSIKINNADVGFIDFLDEKMKHSFLWPETISGIKNPADLEKEILSNFSYITKWLLVNKHSLLAKEGPENIGFNLTRQLQCKTTVISPGFFDEALVAVMVLGKKNGSFTPVEVNNIEYFTTLLAFAISSIHTRELNTTLESRLQQAQKLETIGKLSSGIAHDFSNLLSSIFGSLNLLKRKVPPNEDILRLLDNIEDCSIRAKDLTKGLLSYGKPTPKRKELIKSHHLVEEISRVITQTFPKQIKFEKIVDDELYDILGNGTEIYQVLLNLCVNAKESIDGKGEIKLLGKNLSINDKNNIIYPLLEKGNYVWFSVIDTGQGIKEDDIQKIFDPYFSTKSKDTGSGLGLYVTYGIIKAHKGHIDVSSAIGKGTTFDVFIPSYEPTKVSKAESSEKIILLADDEIMLRDLLAELLEAAGYYVIKVGSGEESLKVLTEEIKVDLLIIDYSMPGMNGLECIEKIREFNTKMPVILSTGSFSIGQKIDLKKMEITDFLTKPYEFDTMLATIKKLI